jgi:NADH-quinone oxidoreductase subunit L
MSLFVFSMLMLVEAGNFLLMLVGWGLVGLASYLLIGFWHHKPEAVAAAKKAFVMNAIGDATFALACVLLIAATGTLEFGSVFDQVDSMSTTTVNLVALGLLGGALAKSAQIPLHTWLPDAMEGPTPVSALIHAATMVTAGVYLLVRASPIFEAAPDVQHLAAISARSRCSWQVSSHSCMGHQARDRVLDDVADRLHVPGAGNRRVRLRDLPLMTHAFFKALLS